MDNTPLQQMAKQGLISPFGSQQQPVPQSANNEPNLRQLILDIASTPVTSPYGVTTPYDVFSGGINTGTDLGVPEGTPVALPPTDTWKVLDSYAGAKPGYIGDNDNSGYGNSVYAQNKRTGEKLRFSHLSENNAYVGQELQGGSPLGKSGRTGNVTGPHLDLEYYDKDGNLGDVLQSPYGQYIPVGQQ